jgi:hypothetical protein
MHNVDKTIQKPDFAPILAKLALFLANPSQN